MAWMSVPFMKEVDMKSLVLLWSHLAREWASICHTSTDRDIRTVAGRVECEGESFLTITLPALGKSVDLALQTGQLATTAFHKRGGLPVFLQGFLRQIFDTDGVILSGEEVSVDAVEAVRHLCYVFQKVELECSFERKSAAITAFQEADAETGEWDDSDRSGILSDLSRVAALLFREQLTVMDKLVYDGNIVPRHGPGATADRLLGNKKYDLTYWPLRLEAEFPYREFGIPSPRFDMFCRTARVLQPEMDRELPARVILVPKTLKTPRVISAEPAAMQWIQQGLAQPLVSLLEDNRLTRPLIGFTDQSPNRDMAREGSLTGRLATLDMKEASDRVSLNQVTGILRAWPSFTRAVLSCRSNLAELPPEFGGNVVTLRKFAPMGSALCFPLEAMVFLTAAFVGIERSLVRTGMKHLLTRRVISDFHGSVRVYGDDIVVPVEHVEAIKEVFAQLGWVVNSEKSFISGDFRESCGGDYYRGQDVTPVKLRRMPPTSRRSVRELESYVSFRNRLYERGLWRTCAILDEEIRRLIPFPLVSPDAPLLGRNTYLPHEGVIFRGDRWNNRLFHVVRKGMTVKNLIPVSPVSGTGALLKCLLVSSEEADHLEKAGRPVARKMQLRYGRPF
jgi:hypothetical protein